MKTLLSNTAIRTPTMRSVLATKGLVSQKHHLNAMKLMSTSNSNESQDAEQISEKKPRKRSPSPKKTKKADAHSSAKPVIQYQTPPEGPKIIVPAPPSAQETATIINMLQRPQPLFDYSSNGRNWQLCPTILDK